MLPDDLTSVLETIRLARQGLAPDPSLAYIRGAIRAFYREQTPAPEGVAIREEDASPVPGIWLETPDAEAGRTILHVHGGGYYMGDARTWAALTGELARAARVRVLSVDYRLAPEHPYPAALDDCFAAYRWLGDRGDDVVVCGDSAGAALAVGVMLRARDAGAPLPAGAYLVSPWVDLEATGESYDTKAGVDPITDRASLLESAALYLQGHAASDPLVSPVNADLRGLPPVLIHVGSHEVMLDEGVRLARQFAIADVSTRLEVWPYQFHIFQLWHARLAAARRAVADAAAFVREAFDR